MTELMEKMKEVEAEHDDALMETTQEELFQQFEKVESGEGKEGTGMKFCKYYKTIIIIL